MLHQVASNAKRSRFSGQSATQLFTSNGAMPVAVDQQGACKETDSALNFGHQSKGTNAIALTKQETGKDRQRADREGEGERKREKERETEREHKAIETHTATNAHAKKVRAYRDRLEVRSWTWSQHKAILRARKEV